MTRRFLERIAKAGCLVICRFSVILMLVRMYTVLQFSCRLQCLFYVYKRLNFIEVFNDAFKDVDIINLCCITQQVKYIPFLRYFKQQMRHY